MRKLAATCSSQRRREPAGGRPELEHALVEPLALAEREEVDVVAVVADQEHAGANFLAVHARVQAVPVPCDLDERARSRERLAAAAVVLAPCTRPA